MFDSDSNSANSAALQQAEQLLGPGVAVDHQHGYIDALGKNPREGIREDQSWFRGRLLPSIYERMWRPMVARQFFGKEMKGEEERRTVLEMLGTAPGERVLDVGCGTGDYARHLAVAAENGLVIGLDASETMLRQAAKSELRGNLAYVRGDACSLPFADGEFDKVCNVGVIHMLGDPMKALSEMVRVLAPGGRVAIMASCEKVNPLAKGQIRAFGRNELTDALRDEGLVDVQQHVVWRGQFVAGRKAS